MRLGKSNSAVTVSKAAISDLRDSSDTRIDGHVGQVGLQPRCQMVINGHGAAAAGVGLRQGLDSLGERFRVFAVRWPTLASCWFGEAIAIPWWPALILLALSASWQVATVVTSLSRREERTGHFGQPASSRTGEH